MKDIDTIHIELTDNCNLNCSYCYQKYLLQRRPSNYPVFNESAFSIINNSSVRSVNITGGEPTIYLRELLDIAKIFSESGKTVTVTTNGLERIASLEHIDTIIVSLDGFFPEMNIHRNVSSQQYERILDNILFYLSHDVKIQLNIVITECNLYQFGDFIRNNPFSNRVSYSVIAVSDKTADKNFTIKGKSSYSYIAKEILNIYKFYNYHINLKSNLMRKSNFLDTFSAEFPMTFFTTYSVPQNNYRYITKEFTEYEIMYNNYYKISKLITTEIIHLLRSLDSNDWFNPYSLAELISNEYLMG